MFLSPHRRPSTMTRKILFSTHLSKTSNQSNLEKRRGFFITKKNVQAKHVGLNGLRGQHRLDRNLQDKTDGPTMDIKRRRYDFARTSPSNWHSS